MQVFVRPLLMPARDCILGRLQLHNHSGKALRECVVDVARHSISFSEDGRKLALLGKLIELNCEHRLVSERLRQFDLLRPIARPSSMTNADNSFNLSAHHSWNRQEVLGPLCPELVANSTGNPRTILNFPERSRHAHY